MTSAAKTSKTKAAAKQADKSRRVPYDEMCRLMRVYGPTKCLRNRESPCGKGNMKVTSVKRKFYRWFPDLEERFVRDAAGFYRPKFGHEFEMRYREDLRAKDSAILSRKRNDCRKRRYGVVVGGVKKVVASPNAGGATAAVALDSDCAPVSPVSLRDIQDVDLKLEKDVNLKPYTNDGSASVSVIAHDGPLDGSFVAEDGIFDDVERSFYGPKDTEAQTLPALPLVSSSSREDDAPSVDQDIDDMLEETIGDFCETMLLSNGGDGCGPAFHFDAP